MRSKKEAEKHESKYKKIKFVEKRKVIRKLEQIERALKEKTTGQVDKDGAGPNDDQEDALANKELSKMSVEDLKELQTEWKNKLIYIDSYPNNWKYISLFAQSTGDTAKDQQISEQREQNMKKILQTRQIKMQIREQEIAEADKEMAAGDDVPAKAAATTSTTQKKKTNDFFQEVTAGAETLEAEAEDDDGKLQSQLANLESSKKIVGRDGRIGKSQRDLTRDRQKREEYERKRNQMNLEKKWGLQDGSHQPREKKPYHTQQGGWTERRQNSGARGGQGHHQHGNRPPAFPVGRAGHDPKPWQKQRQQSSQGGF